MGWEIRRNIRSCCCFLAQVSRGASEGAIGALRKMSVAQAKSAPTKQNLGEQCCICRSGE